MPQFTTNQNLYKWSIEDKKQTTITESSNNADKIDAKLVEFDEHKADTLQYVIANKSANQSLQSGITTNLTFANLATSGTNDYCIIDENGRIKITKKGIYNILLSVQYPMNTAGDRYITPHDNDYAITVPPARELPTRLQAQLLRYVINANTVLNLTSLQNSGSALDVLSVSKAVIVKVGDLA